MATDEQKIIPNFPNYSFSRSGVVRRITSSKGATLGAVLKPRNHVRQPTYKLYRNRKPHTVSECTLFATVFGHTRYEHRTYKGEQVHTAKLTEAQVREIRALAARGWSHRDIAHDMGCSYGNVRFITAGLTWRHLL